MFVVMDSVLPHVSEKVMKHNAEVTQFTDEPQPPTRGNFYQPMAEGAGVTGGWRRSQMFWVKRGVKAAFMSGMTGAVFSVLRTSRSQKRGLLRYVPMFR
jgi:hypothetical protein